MKIFKIRTLISIVVCLSLSWQSNSPSSKTDSDAMEVDSFQNQTVPESDEKDCDVESDSSYFKYRKRMKFNDCANKEEAESSDKDFKNCTLSYYSDGARTTLCFEKNLSKDFEKLCGSEHFQITEKANVTDFLNLLASIPSNSQNQLDIYHFNIDEFVKEPAKLFDKMTYGSNVTTKGDLSISVFEKFHLKIRELMAIEGKVCYFKHDFSSKMNLFSSLENQSKAEKVLPLVEDFLPVKPTESNPKLRIFLIQGLNNLTVEDIEKDNTEYTSVHVRINYSSNLKVLSAALSKYQIVNLSINLYSGFNNFSELYGIIENRSYTHLRLSGFLEPSTSVDNFLIDLASKASFWKNLKELKLLQFSYQAIFEAFKNELPVLEKLLFWNCFDNSVKLEDLPKAPQVPSVQDFRIALNGRNLSKESIEYLLDIFPNAKRVFISADSEVTGFQVKSKNLVKLQIHAKSIKNEHEFMTNLTKPKFSFISIQPKIVNRLVWTKVDDRIFYETRFENLIAPEMVKKLIEDKKE